MQTYTINVIDPAHPGLYLVLDGEEYVGDSPTLTEWTEHTDGHGGPDVIVDRSTGYRHVRGLDFCGCGETDPEKNVDPYAFLCGECSDARDDDRRAEALEARGDR